MSTVVPLTSEAEWLPKLQSLVEWELPLIPALILAPHPDDETLGAGGLIAKLSRAGVPVTIAAITNGEGAYTDTPDLANIRMKEQAEALNRLGVPAASIHRFHLPDREVSAHEDNLVNQLLPLLASQTHLIAPWPHDFHPDHEAAGRAAELVARRKNLPITYYLFWTWHRGEPSILNGLELAKLSLSDAEWQAKQHALQAHVSQIDHADGQPILSPELLMPAQRHFEVYLR